MWTCPECSTVWRAMDAHKLKAGRAEAWDWRWEIFQASRPQAEQA
jgi:hypothetical protein